MFGDLRLALADRIRGWRVVAAARGDEEQRGEETYFSGDSCKLDRLTDVHGALPPRKQNYAGAAMAASSVCDL
jgi:hypothetical protein